MGGVARGFGWGLHLLGSLRLVAPDGREAPIGSKVAATLLGYVALRQTPVPRTTIQEMLWPESDGDRQAQNYRRALSNLRQFFEQNGSELVLDSSPTSIALIPGTLRVDAHDFRDAARAALDHRSISELTTAADLYTGALWQDGPEEWVLAARQELEELYAQVIGDLTIRLADSGELREAVRVARTAVTKAPLREDVHADLIRAYARAGMPSEALKQFEVLEAMLDEHWGEAPSVMSLTALDCEPSKAVRSATIETAPASPRLSHVRRSADDAMDAALRVGEGVIVIQGPRQVGKSTMLARALRMASEEGALPVLSDFQAHEAALLADTEKFCRAVATLFVQQVGAEIALETGWNDWVGPNANLDAVVKTALESTDRRVIWAIDELDQLLGLQTGNDFLGLVRSWHNRRALEPEGPWSRLTVLIAHTGEIEALISDPRQSPFDVGVVIDVEDLAREQVGELNETMGSPVTPGELDAIFEQTQGHPYVTRRVLETAGKLGFESAMRLLEKLVTAATRPPEGWGRRGVPRERHNLIGLERPFVGRVKEREALSAAVCGERSRLVTLLGFGGMGKSTLANVVAWDSLPAFDEGVWWAECESSRTAEQALAAMAAALGEPLVEGSVDLLAEAIGRRHLLLVLDCCEGLAGELGFVARLVRACPHLHVLATSRRTLDLPGEHVYELEGLDQIASRGGLSDAEQLFVDAAIAADPEFDVEAHRKTVTRIVRRLEGIPLALILAASRLRHMGLEDVDGRLEKGQLATVRAPSGKGRHSSLHQIVASTLALVELEDQKMASRVAVFQGGFRLDDAQSVLGDSRDTLDQLSRLRDCSL
ncbi:MAG TPA: AAA-like domain-containing protein, partial [Fimbriimonadaceae bacterium]|nr:AAA-like domain-containing protein [Fimbriimonadaceae bacterium]